MPDTLDTLSAFVPVSACRLPSGHTLFANGVDKVRHWDGVDELLDNAGIPVPVNGSFAASGDVGDAGTIDGDYVVAVRFVDADGTPGDLGTLVSFAATSDTTVSYTNVPLSSDTRVTKREIYRSTEGQSITLYKVATINDNNTTTASETYTDEELVDLESLPVTNPDGSVNSRRFGIPPDWKRQVLHHLGRTLWLANVTYTEGHIEVTQSSTTVQGRGTNFTAQMVGRVLHVTDHAHAFTIDDVDTVNQTLTIDSAYTGATDKFAVYAIKPEAAESSTVYWSSADEPEAVYSLNSDIVDGQEDGEITGGFILNSQAYIMRERQLRAWPFQVDPAVDGATFKRANRGCVNERCVAVFDGMAALLDREGIYLFDGGSVDPISKPIQDYFRKARINWAREKFFHACVDESRETVKFFVCLTDSDYPRHALCFQYRRRNWWIEEYPVPISASCSCVVGGEVRLLLGGPHEKVFLAEEGTLDGPSLSFTPRLDVVSATFTTLCVQPTPDWDNDDLAGAPVQIVAGPGKGQWRRILTATASTGKLQLDRPWLILPTEESVVQIGGVGWSWKTGHFRYLPAGDSIERKLSLTFQQTTFPGSFDIRRYVNHELDPVDEKAKHDNYDGVTTECDSPDATVTLTKRRAIGQSSGYACHRWDDRLSDEGSADRFVQVELRGWQNLDPVTIHGVTISGVQK